MTEEIIIDGVNVAGCEFYFKDEKYSCDLSFINKEELRNCDNINDCYYKQLKRLEQENSLLSYNLHLKEQEIKELKIYVESNKQQVEEAEMLVMDNNKLQQEVENLKDIIYYDVEKYRSALEEILESAKFAQCLPCGSGNLEDCLNCNDETTNNGQFCMEKRIHEIKTKCVEVLR